MPTPRPLPDLPGVYYARTVGAYGGRPDTNIFTFRTASPPAPGAADVALAGVVANAVAARWNAFTSGSLPTGYTCTEVDVYALHSPTAPKVTATCGATGSLSGAITSATTAYVVRHTVFRRGRGSQSRTSISPVTSASMTADGLSLTSTTQTAFNTAFNTFLTEALADLTASGTGIWSYVQLAKGTAAAPTPATYPITLSVVETKLSTQRSRVKR